MDATTLSIAIGASALFFGVLIWKAIWLVRKIKGAPAPLSAGKDPLSDEGCGGKKGGKEARTNNDDAHTPE